MKPFRVSQIDHVEVFVPDRYEAAEWYKRTLGLDIVPGYEQWAANPRGPLMISSDDGSTKLALFEGQSQESGPMSGWHLVAFRVDADGFLEFVTRLADRPLIDHQGRPGHRRFSRRPRKGVFGVFFRPVRAPPRADDVRLRGDACGADAASHPRPLTAAANVARGANGCPGQELASRITVARASSFRNELTLPATVPRPELASLGGSADQSASQLTSRAADEGLFPVARDGPVVRGARTRNILTGFPGALAGDPGSRGNTASIDDDGRRRAKNPATEARGTTHRDLNAPPNPGSPNSACYKET